MSIISGSQATFFSNLLDDSDDEEVTLDQIKDQDELEKGIRCFIDDSEIHKITSDETELIVHDFMLPIFSDIINQETGTLTNFGQRFLEDSGSISQDINCLFSYFSPFVHASMKDVNDAELNPFVLYKFFSELYDYQSSSTSLTGCDPQILSTFILKVLINTPQFLKKSNNEAVLEDIMQILNDNVQDEINKEAIKSMVEESFCSAINSSYSQIYNNPTDKVFEIFSIRNSDVEELKRNFVLQENRLMMNTFLHYVSQKAENIYSRSNFSSEMMTDIEERLSYVAQSYGALIGNKEPKGSSIIHIHVDWEPKFKNSRLMRAAFIELSYMKEKTLLQLKDGTDAEIILPFFDKSQNVEIRLKYILEKHDGTPLNSAKPEQTNTLLEQTVHDLSENSTTQNKFKKTSSLVPTTCGKLTTEVKYSRTGKVEVNGKFLTNDIDSYVCDIVDVILSRLSHIWMSQSKTISVFPPIEIFLILIELCVRYSVPSSYVFLKIFENIYSCWNESESYLGCIFVLYLITKNSIFLCNSTDAQKDKFSAIEKEIFDKVYFALQFRFKYPWKHERSSLKDLILFYSVLQDEQQKEEEKQDVFLMLVESKKETKGFVLGTIFSKMKPQVAEKRATEELIDLVQYIKNECPTVKLEECDSGCFTFSMETMADVCDLISTSQKQMKRFYDENTVPYDLKVTDEIESVIRQISGKLIRSFVSLKPDPSDPFLFKFYSAYRDLYEQFKLGKEFSPYKLFFDVIVMWLSSISDKLLTWTKRAVDKDTFEIDDKRHMTSTSLADIMAIFSQSFSFIQKLKWKDRNIVDIIETFLAMCSSCLKYYTELLMMMIFTYFPHDVIVSNSDPVVYNGILSQVSLVYRGKSLTPEQIYVIINDFMSIKDSWLIFLQQVQPFLGAHKIPEQLQDPVPYTQQIIDAIPGLFAGLVAQEVHSYISERLWVENSSVKTLFVKKASKKVLHPDFDSHSSQFFNDLYINSIQFITGKCESLKNFIRSDKLIQMLESFIRGLDAGLMNTMIKEDEPIKHKRIEAILDFVKSIQNQMYETMRDEHNVPSTMYLKWSWRSKLMLDHINYSPKEILAVAMKEKGQRGLVFFILARSFTNDKLCKHWAEENEPRYRSMRFTPRD